VTGMVLSRRRRGATILLFLLVMIPFAMLSMMMAADMTRLIDAQRQAGYVAAAAATAGSLQYEGPSSQLNRRTAQTVAVQTAQANFNAGALRHGIEPQAVATATARQVTVTVSYKLDGLIIAQYFVGPDQRLRGVTRVAEVCHPGETPVAGGYCSRPRAR
jgi:Flp pilus assembly protein TadG